jgi:hypothetical protein
VNGQLLAVADPVPGRTHDRAAFTATGFDQLLIDTDTVGDLGYQGTTVIRPRRKRPGHPDHDPATTIRNRSIASIRVAVERAIAHWKNWKILATGYRGRLTHF